jgi:hypothetical protein
MKWAIGLKRNDSYARKPAKNRPERSKTAVPDGGASALVLPLLNPSEPRAEKFFSCLAVGVLYLP